MNEILVNSLIRKNKQVYKGALAAVEDVMGNDFKSDKRFEIIRGIILTIGNDTARSIQSELDEYYIVKKDDSVSVTQAVDLIFKVLPNLTFGFLSDGENVSSPFIHISSVNHSEINMLRKILGHGIVSKMMNKSRLEIYGVRDCLDVIPTIDIVMHKVPNNDSYRQWLEGVHSQYKETV